MGLIVYDKDGEKIPIRYKTGQALHDILRLNGIPISSVILEIDGKIVPIEVALHKPITDNSNFEIQVTENFLLREVITPPIEIKQDVDDPYFVQRLLRMRDSGPVIEEYRFDRNTFVELVETKFVRNILENELISNGDVIILGFSGGTDSTFILHMLQKMKDRLPKFELIAVTITDLPDVNLDFAHRYCEDYGIKHIVVDDTIVRQIFHLRAPFVEVIQSLARSPYAEQALYIGHHVIRRSLEVAATQVNSKKIILGLEREEFLPAILGSLTTGVPTLGIAKRVGPQFAYIFPNYTISKREVLLYLRAELPDYHTPGPYQRVTLGGFSPTRALYFYLAGHMYEIWPGLEYHFFAGYRDILRKIESTFNFATCSRCGGDFLIMSHDSHSSECMACQVLRATGWTIEE